MMDILQNMLGRPVRLMIADTGADAALVEARLRPKMNLIPWRTEKAYAGLKPGESHGSYVKMIASEFFSSPDLVADVDVTAYQCLDENGSGTSAMIASAVKHAAATAQDDLNMSLGISFAGDRQREIVRRDLDDCGTGEAGESLYYDGGGVVVCAAGNEDRPEDYKRDNICFPAMYPWAMGLGALKPNGAKSDFSSDGRGIEEMALGEDYYGIGWLDGTSFASPVTCGWLAWLKAYVVGEMVTGRQLRRAIRAVAVHGGAHPHDTWCRDHGYGSLMRPIGMALSIVKLHRIEAGVTDWVEPFRIDPIEPDTARLYVATLRRVLMEAAGAMTDSAR
jgi:hypothetical protein